MRNEELLNLTELRKAIAQLKPDNELFEVRIMGEKIKPISGYFRDVEVLIKAFDTVDLRNTNVYMTLNKPADALYSRQQSDRLINSKSTTSDKEIEYFEWLFIDLDPTRPTGISSTDEELKAASDLAQQIYVYLKGIGFEEPVKAFSGNGYHLLYAIRLNNTEDNKNLIKRCLEALDLMFSNELVKVDTANHNPSRICKLYGTLAQKGRNTADRPHRMAKIDGDIKPIKATQKIYLEKLASDIPTEEIKPAKYNNYVPAEFDIESWMDDHFIRYKVKNDTESVKYILEECPFDSNHKAPDSMIFKMPNGAIGFKCLHDSCSNYHWQDVRIKYEPDAYEQKNEAFDKAIEEGWKRHNRDKQQEEKTIDEPVWETITDILKKPTPNNEYIKTHIDCIDKKMHGLLKGSLSVWSGLRASAKSTILSQIALSAVNDDHNVLVFSGELTDKRFAKWLIQQAAGKQYAIEYEFEESKYWIVPEDKQKQIANWIDNRLFVYNNKYGAEYKFLVDNLESKIQEVIPDLIVLDNLMTIDINDINSNEYRAQTELMLMLSSLAKKYNCHIALVAHPRKTVSFLRLTDISGSGNIANLVDSAFIVHRVNHDFKKGYMDEFCRPGTEEEDVMLFYSTNVIEIAKDREEGIQDEFIPLWYEPESRRVKNNQTEVMPFKWTTEWHEEEKHNDFMDAEDIPWD